MPLRHQRLTSTMAAWPLAAILTLAAALLLRLLLLRLKPPSSSSPLPPGPSAVAFFAKHVVFHRKNLFQLEQVVRQLHAAYGPVVALRTLPSPTVFVQDAAAAHRALVQLGPAVADRPPTTEPMTYLTCNGYNINTANYGPLWRVLRRNLASEMLHPSRIKLYSPARRWAVGALLKHYSGEEGRPLVIKHKLKTAVFSLLTALCFGQALGRELIEEVIGIQCSLLLSFTRFNPFAVLPKVTKVVFANRWRRIVELRRRQAEIFAPLIAARRANSDGELFLPYCYVDSLLDVEIAEEGGRRLREDEIVGLCHEFLAAGTDTTTNSLEWIMAELVKNQPMQERLREEIDGAVHHAGEEIEEEDLQEMPYLKAVIMEGLRRHPPAHFVLPHRAVEDVTLRGYSVPKGAEVHINIAQLGWDGRVWSEPMEFRPERFLPGGEGEGVDVTGTREIKMMPFGAGRRICPGMGLATLHLEYFVANLAREFEWRAEEGEEIDLAEEFEFTTIMKYPLRARIIRRRRSEKKMSP